MRYRSKTGCQWRMLPKDFPKWESVASHYYDWNKRGVFKRTNDALREIIRAAEGREVEPSLGIVDSQSVKTTASSPVENRGFDAAKKVKGRKRHILVDILGLLIALHITPADVQDRDAIEVVLTKAQSQSTRLEKVLVDSVYRGPQVELAAARTGIKIEVVSRSNDRPGFSPIPKRWVVERSFGWANHSRVLSKDYERTIASAEGWFYFHSVCLMAQRFV